MGCVPGSEGPLLDDGYAARNAGLLFFVDLVICPLGPRCYIVSDPNFKTGLLIGASKNVQLGFAEKVGWMRIHLRAAGYGLLALLYSSPVLAETVDVKYRGPVDLKQFVCTDTKSSFVNRVCYDKKETYMLILLNRTWYHYCEIPERVVQTLLSADSKGRYYNANIKGTGNDGPYDCRTHRVPNY